jgi:hypothetical protein
MAKLKEGWRKTSSSRRRRTRSTTRARKVPRTARTPPPVLLSGACPREVAATVSPADRLRGKLAPLLSTLTPTEWRQFSAEITPPDPVSVCLESALAAIDEQGAPRVSTGLPIELAQVQLPGATAPIGAFLLNARLAKEAIAQTFRQQFGDDPQWVDALDDAMLSGACESLLRDLERQSGSWLAAQIAWLPYGFWASTPERLLEVLEQATAEQLRTWLIVVSVRDDLARIQDAGTRALKKRARAIWRRIGALKPGRPKKRRDDLENVRLANRFAEFCRRLNPGFAEEQANRTQRRRDRRYPELTSAELRARHGYSAVEAEAIITTKKLKGAALVVLGAERGIPPTRNPGCNKARHNLRVRVSAGESEQRQDLSSLTATIN